MIAREIFGHASSSDIGKQKAIYFKLFDCSSFIWLGVFMTSQK